VKVALSFWGVCAKFDQHRFEMLDTPDGHRYGRPLLVDALKAAGHEVIALQQKRESIPYHGLKYALETHDIFPDVDVVFLEYRWPTYKNDRTHPQHDPLKYEPDLDRQREIIEFYKGKVPIIAWDTDLKITPEDEAAYPELILADPSFMTNQQTRDRISLPFWTDWSELFPVVEPYPVYGYVGNNYERPTEFQRYYYSSQRDMRLMGVQTSMYGNWLQRSPERETPQSLVSMHREVAFNDRRDFYQSMAIMNRFICTTHVSKPRYYETGFISPRYLEALACNCPGLVPASQIFNGILGRRNIVRSTSDVVDCVRRLKDLTVGQRAEIMHEQREMMKRTGKFNVENVVSFITSQRTGS
jgi:hypothetical protein